MEQTQKKSALLERSNDPTVVEPAEAPIVPSEPNRKMIVVLITLLSGLGIVVRIVANQIIKKMGHSYSLPLLTWLLLLFGCTNDVQWEAEFKPLNKRGDVYRTYKINLTK